jgi:hypothetical protein
MAERVAAVGVSDRRVPAHVQQLGSGMASLRLLNSLHTLTTRQVNTYGTYASYYMQHLIPNQNILLLNLVGATQSFVVLILSAPVGRFLDAGYIRPLLIAGTVLVSLGSYLLSIVNGNAGFAEGRWVLIWLTQGVISGLGMACFFVSSSQGQYIMKLINDVLLKGLQLLQRGSKRRKVLLLEWSL